jgi:hypothetical protein
MDPQHFLKRSSLEANILYWFPQFSGVPWISINKLNSALTHFLMNYKDRWGTMTGQWLPQNNPVMRFRNDDISSKEEKSSVTISVSNPDSNGSADPDRGRSKLYQKWKQWRNFVSEHLKRSLKGFKKTYMTISEEEKYSKIFVWIRIQQPGSGSEFSRRNIGNDSLIGMIWIPYSQPVWRIRIRMVLGLMDPDPLVGGTRYRSGTFYHQAKIARKTLIPTALWLLYDFLSLKNDVNVASKSNKQNNFCYHL